MRVLRNELNSRVAFWIDNDTPYCVFRQPGESFCLNCGDFVARILFPGSTPQLVGLPKEFTRTLGDMPTTDDLLIYMLGLHNLPDAKSRLQRLASLKLPECLRLDVAAMLQPDNTALAQPPRQPPPPAARRKRNRDPALPSGKPRTRNSDPP